MGAGVLLSRGSVLLGLTAMGALGASCADAGGRQEEAAGEPPGLVVGAHPDDPHGTLTCLSCHDGPLPANRTVPVATRQGCTESGCHEEEGPGRVAVAGVVSFPHRDHPEAWGEGEGGDLSCVACHRHEAGWMPLATSTAACGLCHADAMDGAPADECLTCHTDLDHTPRTPQGLPVSHSGIPWLDTGCVRCHYEVLDEAPLQGFAECVACHGPGTPLALGPRQASWVGGPGGEGGHAIHQAVPCVSCHQGRPHRVVAQSAAVYLDCASCHAPAHTLEVDRMPPSKVCLDCHVAVHQAQQGLFIGSVPWDSATFRPSVKFAAGLACGECHVAGIGGTGSVEREETVGGGVPADPDACAACHLPEYRTVAAWWREGGEARVARVATYLGQAESALGPEPLAEAAGRFAFVRAGGFYHSPERADLFLREVLQNVVDAYRVAGRAPPAPPNLGPAPRAGFCSYCHLEPEGSWSLSAMPEDFHRRVLTGPGG